VLARHGDRPAHVHFFVTSDKHRKLTTQINIEGDPLIWDDFAYATREDLIPHVVEKSGGTALDMKADTYKDIEFNIELTPLVQGKDNQARPSPACVRHGVTARRARGGCVVTLPPLNSPQESFDTDARAP
jgi:hypothetical protein